MAKPREAPGRVERGWLVRVQFYGPVSSVSHAPERQAPGQQL